MSQSKNTGIAFFVIGVTFLVLGANNTAFFAFSMPFLVLGITMMARNKTLSNE